MSEKGTGGERPFASTAKESQRRPLWEMREIDAATTDHARQCPDRQTGRSLFSHFEGGLDVTAPPQPGLQHHPACAAVPRRIMILPHPPQASSRRKAAPGRGRTNRHNRLSSVSSRATTGIGLDVGANRAHGAGTCHRSLIWARRHGNTACWMLCPLRLRVRNSGLLGGPKRKRTWILNMKVDGCAETT